MTHETPGSPYLMKILNFPVVLYEFMLYFPHNKSRFLRLGGSSAVVVVLEDICHRLAQVKAHRLNMMATCSLHMKTLTLDLVTSATKGRL